MKKLLLTITLCFCALFAQAKEAGLSITTATTSGSVTRGARSVTFIFSSDFAGTVAGVAFAGATDSSFTPPIQTGDTFSAIAYTVTAGNVRIAVVR